MNHIAILITKLWTVLTTRADALRRACMGFENAPETLSRRAHAMVSRELRKLEGLLRRKILYDAHQIHTVLLPQPPKRPRAEAKARRDSKSGTLRTASFRLDEGRAGDAFKRQVLQFLGIKDRAPAPLRNPPAEYVNADALVRRARAFYAALGNTDALAQKLARRLARHGFLRVRSFRTAEHEHSWENGFDEIDEVFTRLGWTVLALNTS